MSCIRSFSSSRVSSMSPDAADEHAPARASNGGVLEYERAQAHRTPKQMHQFVKGKDLGPAESTITSAGCEPTSTAAPRDL